MLRRPVSWLTSAAVLMGTVSSIPMQVQAQPMPVQAQVQVQLYSAPQLDSILAPIALYPDVLLTQVLMAAAFPPQVVEAGSWVQNPAHRQLQGDALAQALAPMEWDPSVKSLVPFPGVLAQLNGNLPWLEQLGYASANQQADVLDSVQRLRHRASLAGNLRSSPQYIIRQEARFIYIEPAQPNVIYVPAYNPVVVYGAWGYPAYPPVYLVPPQGYGWGPIVGAGLFFSTAIIVSVLFWDLGRPHWRDRRIFVNANRYNTINVNRAPYRGGDVWRPHQAATYNNDAFRNHQPPSMQGGPGPDRPGQPPRIPGGSGPSAGQPSRIPGGPGQAGPGQAGPGQAGPGQAGPGQAGPGQAGPGRLGQPPLGQGGPGAGGPGAGGRPDVAAPGQQPRVPGAPGTAGQSGVPAPGLQPRVPGAPGTAGQSGVFAPGQRGDGIGAPHATPGGPGAAGRPDVSVPGQQPRMPGGPGAGGQSGVMPSGPQGGGSVGSGAPHATPRDVPSGQSSGRAIGGPSGGSDPAAGNPRAPGGGNAAPRRDAGPQGGNPRTEDKRD